MYVCLCSYVTNCLRNNQTFITEINKCTVPQTKLAAASFSAKKTQ